MAVTPDRRIPVIQAALSRYNLSYRALAKLIGRDHTVVTSWMNGKNAPHDKRVFDDILRTVENYGNSIGDSADNVDIRRVGVRRITVYLTLLGGEASPSSGETTMINLMDWGTDRERYGLKVFGFEMAPLLEPNNVAIIEKDRDWNPRDVVHAVVNGKDFLRAVRKRGSALVLTALDTDFPDLDCSESDIKGVVMGRISTDPDGKRTTEEWEHGMRVKPTL